MCYSFFLEIPAPESLGGLPDPATLLYPSPLLRDRLNRSTLSGCFDDQPNVWGPLALWPVHGVSLW